MRHGGSPFGADDPCDECYAEIRKDRIFLIKYLENLKIRLLKQACTDEWPCDHKGGLGSSCWIFYMVSDIDKALKKVE